MKKLIVVIMLAVLFIPGTTMARIGSSARVMPRPSIRVTPRAYSVPKAPIPKPAPKIKYAPKPATPNPAPKTNYASNHSTVHSYIPTWLWFWMIRNETEQKQEKKAEHFGCGRWK